MHWTGGEAAAMPTNQLKRLSGLLIYPCNGTRSYSRASHFNHLIIITSPIVNLWKGRNFSLILTAFLIWSLPVFAEPRVVSAGSGQSEDDLVPAGAPHQDGDDRCGQGLHPLGVGGVEGSGRGLNIEGTQLCNNLCQMSRYWNNFMPSSDVSLHKVLDKTQSKESFYSWVTNKTWITIQGGPSGWKHILMTLRTELRFSWYRGRTFNLMSTNSIPWPDGPPCYQT